jgi:hypothetical protein
LAASLVFPVRRLAPEGLEAWKQVVERGYEYEGYVVKNEASVYEGGPQEAVVEVRTRTASKRTPRSGGPACDSARLRNAKFRDGTSRAATAQC